jgi:hypothetical protein
VGCERWLELDLAGYTLLLIYLVLIVLVNIKFVYSLESNIQMGITRERLCHSEGGPSSRRDITKEWWEGPTLTRVAQ